MVLKICAAATSTATRLARIMAASATLNLHPPEMRLPSSSSSRCRPMSSIRRLATDDPRMAGAVVYQGIVYTSGQVDITADDVVGQTQNVLAKIDDLLAQAGTSKSSILTASIWLKDIERDFQSMNQVWTEWIDPDNKPVRATTQAPMASPKILVEVQVSAAAGTADGK